MQISRGSIGRPHSGPVPHDISMVTEGGGQVRLRSQDISICEDAHQAASGNRLKMLPSPKWLPFFKL